MTRWAGLPGPWTEPGPPDGGGSQPFICHRFARRTWRPRPRHCPPAGRQGEAAHRVTSVPGSGVLRAAVVGAGSGGMLSIRALQSSERYALVGVADVSEAARTRAAEDGVTAEMFADAASLLEAVEPEVVCVSTFAPSHAAARRPGARSRCSRSTSGKAGRPGLGVRAGHP